ncbi:alpha/beta fold hydrolase [Seonamhaeicola marinus]|uniref:Alpha/beta hydrolase n=1 Tax=Seonamhaeicola marinus TaxID=1912246 RepID=A0A5D0HLF3_9FLAO|nr:alpha/beta hydrolase [Seonamhaeicola marinus]TYA70132.1 alpha/beta hydrolase [Seonamhaeicola marinus]
MTLKYKGLDIFFKDEGKGGAVVLLHGFLENSSIWKDLSAEISKRHRVISIDLLGHGKTGCLGYIHSMELMAEVVEAVLKHLKIRKSILIGHSMGGYVALAYAEKNPDNVKGLCLLNSTASADTPEKKINRDRGIEAVKKNHKTFIRIAVANLFSSENQKLFSKDIKKLIDQCLKTPLQGIVAALEGMKIRNDREVLLHFSPYRKLMIIGKKDPALNYEALIAQTKNTKVKVVEFDGGHMSFIENKTECKDTILHFIENK